MARLTLLNVSMLLLLAAGRSSIAWPYPEGDSEHDSEVMEKNESTDDDLIQEQAVTEDEFNMQEQVPMKEFENVNAMADYHGGHSQTAEISQAG